MLALGTQQSGQAVSLFLRAAAGKKPVQVW
jgi:hypothetical protein